MALKPIRLGKGMAIQYIPFSQLVIPWDACINSNAESEQDSLSVKQLGILTFGAVTPDSLKALKTVKQEDLDALKASIGQFGLLKPFEVAELPEQLDFFFGKGKYVVMDGQRRYFAIRELLRLPTVQKEQKERDELRSNSGNHYVEKTEIQAQEHLEKLSVRDYVLIPCLVYPYTTYLQMMRHSTEDSKFSGKPSKIFLEMVEQMRQQGISDLIPDDLSDLWETRNAIEEEQRAIEETLQEIRNRKK